MTPLPRSQLRLPAGTHHLDHASLGPLPEVARAAAAEVLEGQVVDPRGTAVDREHRLDEARAAVAGLLGARPADVAFVANTTDGIARIARGWVGTTGAADVVLVAAHEFVSNRWPWSRRPKTTVVEVPPTDPAGGISLERWAELVSAHPGSLVAVSWVQYARGARTDLPALAELCHAHGAILVVDAIQGLGVLPAAFTTWGVDAAVAGGHKWLLGPEGTGILFVAPHLLDRIDPIGPGWRSVVPHDSFDEYRDEPRPDARRHEGGTPNAAGIAALGASARLLADAGLSAIEAHVHVLLDRLADGARSAGATVLSDRSPGVRSAICTIGIGVEPPPSLRTELHAAGVTISIRGGGIRVSPHGHNDADDIDALLSLVPDLLRRR